MSRDEQTTLIPPGSGGPVLLHSCCAPCSGEIMQALSAARIPYAVFFYNPNIHPKPEYLLRKEENSRFAERNGIPFIDADYDEEEWFSRVRGLEMETERGARCSVCFDMRLERAALYADENGFSVMATSLGISRWKNLAQVNACGHRAADRYNGLVYWDFNWRSRGGSARAAEVAKREQFYRQDYCGCVYSLRDANLRRRQESRAPISPGGLSDSGPAGQS